MRSFRTLRVSVTDRCDLDCVYCDAAESTPAEVGSTTLSPPRGEVGSTTLSPPRGEVGSTTLSPPRGEVGPTTLSPPLGELSVKEIVLLAQAAAAAGARTVRLTGGEPLLREDIEDIVSRIGATGRVSDTHIEIALTTNAQRLAPRARALKGAGLDRVNIGLPSLVPSTYRRMTKGDLGPAREGLEAALAEGLSPVKVNVVLIRGMNADEIDAFIELAYSRPVEVRFIERMPFAGGDNLVPAAEVRKALAAALGAEAVGSPELSPTAELYRPRGFAGRVGLISPVTAPFCERCDRLRVTSDGRLRSCLSEPGETDLRRMLDSGASPEALARAMRNGFDRKPERHRATFRGPMRRIGG